jgi:DNA processing protein
MAVPGNITSLVSVGTNRLIRDGAGPVLEPADLLQHFPEVGGSTQETTMLPAVAHPLPETLSYDERELAGFLGEEPIHPDELATRFKRPVGEVLGLLSGLEIAGVIEQRPGRVFKRV